MDEIKATPEDRAAVGIIARYFLELDNFQASSAGLDRLNGAWSYMATKLGAGSDRDFEGVLKGVEGQKAKMVETQRKEHERGFRSDYSRAIAELDRALELLELVVEWRWTAAASRAEGRGEDPYTPPPERF